MLWPQAHRPRLYGPCGPSLTESGRKELLGLFPRQSTAGDRSWESDAGSLSPQDKASGKLAFGVSGCDQPAKPQTRREGKGRTEPGCLWSSRVRLSFPAEAVHNAPPAGVGRTYLAAGALDTLPGTRPY